MHHRTYQNANPGTYRHLNGLAEKLMWVPGFGDEGWVSPVEQLELVPGGVSSGTEAPESFMTPVPPGD